ncbi:MAG: sulfotransferase [Solirubrobacterales bacterium]
MGIAVIGMDRSGTSLAMQMLAALGVELGSEGDLLKPHPLDNPHGYKELTQLIGINRRLLELIEADPLDVDLGVDVNWGEPRFDDLRASAQELVKLNFGHEPWAIKDPRITLVASFWRSVFPGLEFVICLRDPASVIRSQERRESNYEDRERLMRKWLRYTISSFAATAGARRLIVNFDDAVGQPRVTAAAYASFLDVSVPTDQRLDEIERLVDPALVERQSKSAANERITLPAEVDAIYELFRSAANDASALGSATSIAARLEHALIARMGAEWRLAEVVGGYESSKSWRITAPLRSIAARIRRN